MTSYAGYLHNKSLEDIRLTIEELAETSPEDVPEESKFVLEINFGDLTKSHIENHQYWIVALQAAIQRACDPQRQAAESGALDTESTANFPAVPSLASLR
jgi:hypothetical protein